MKKKILIIALLFFIIIQYQFIAYGLDFPIKITIPQGVANYVYTFDYPVDIKTVINTNSSVTLNDTNITFYNSSEQKIGTTVIRNNVRQTKRVVDYKDVTKVIFNVPQSYVITIELFDSIITELELNEIFFNTSKQEIKYIFNKNFDINEDDILFKDNKNNDIPFNFSIVGKDLIIKPKNILLTGDYSTTLLSVTAYDDYFGYQQLENLNFTFTIDEPLKLIEYKYNAFDSKLECIFNNKIIANISDISIVNKSGDNQLLDYQVLDNKIVFNTSNYLSGDYTLKINKVTNYNDSEDILSDLADYKFNISGIKLIYKNFGNFISSSLQNLILTFDRKIESANIILKNETDDLIVNTNLIISNDKFIIDYDPFKPGTSYTLTIESLNAVDGNVIESPMIFEFKTIKSTGDVGTDIIISEFLNIFTEAQNRGIKIVILAILLGIIFIIAKWLWNKTKMWLKKL
ncbi:hypothetical protein [Sedimentibacter sp.]|uniref:hypothetical protein n=1 Tax=Sedimentibacter sp. TaxID=1960295 RepID=UPI0028A68AAA|nr:hypothetical protein [Sedimentibacter sp.]